MVTTLVRGHYESPIGLLEVRGSEMGILSIKYTEDEHPEAGTFDCLQECIDQLHAYFGKKDHIFHSLPLLLNATDFQREVWDEVCTIPPGQQKTYGQIAKMIGNPHAMRAVGTALKTNPLLIVIPCHRVVPQKDGIGNYAGGNWRKEWLLSHEET